jgi:hypothetical protein
MLSMAWHFSSRSRVRATTIAPVRRRFARKAVRFLQSGADIVLMAHRRMKIFASTGLREFSNCVPRWIPCFARDKPLHIHQDRAPATLVAFRHSPALKGAESPL